MVYERGVAELYIWCMVGGGVVRTVCIVYGGVGGESTEMLAWQKLTLQAELQLSTISVYFPTEQQGMGKLRLQPHLLVPSAANQRRVPGNMEPLCSGSRRISQAERI